MVLDTASLRIASEADARHWMGQIFQSYGGDWGDFDRGTVEPAALVQRIARRTGLSEAEVQRVVDAVPHELQPQPATVALLRQLHALVFGYQAAYPAFRGPEAKVVFDLLYRRREERDRLTAWLRERGQTVPAAEAAYALPGQPADRPRAVQLLAQMEIAYQPFAGAWVAAATDPGSRRAALEALEEAVRLGLQWGGPLARWPGWPG